MKLIAHACGPTVYPSNTIFSAREALKSGADMVELDLQFTSDKKIAVFHDRDLLKKFGIPERCCEVSSERFLSLRRSEDPACPGHLLEDYFRCDIAPILLHLKLRVLEETIELIDKYNYRERVVFGVSELCCLIKIKEIIPDAKVLGFIPDPEQIEAFAENGVDFIRLWERWLTAENISRVKASGAELWVMTGGKETDFRVGLPDREDIIRLAALEPDGLLVNNVPFVKSVLSNF